MKLNLPLQTCSLGAVAVHPENRIDTKAFLRVIVIQNVSSVKCCLPY